MTPTDETRTSKPSFVVPLAAGCGAFVVGVGLTFGYVQWQAQQDKLAQMAQMIEDMQQGTTQPEAVTRSSPVDLLSVATTAAATAPAAAPAPATTPEPTLAAAPAPEAPVDDVARTTADRIRALVARSSDPMVSAAIARDVARRETMSIAIQGVNELVAAATAGDYTLSIEGDGAAGTPGQLRIRFPKNADDQAELERLLSSAAGAGMIAFSDSVKSSDGSFSGPVILFDLVERALLNGSAAERRTGLQIRQKAVALLQQKPNVASVSQNASGQRFYTVEAGDSLAYIALQFYGNTNDYRRIFTANRDQLSSPEKIQIGQKLLIPEV